VTVVGAPWSASGWPVVGLALDSDAGLGVGSASDAVAAASTTDWWYYCIDPAGYFPHVSRCSRPWVVVDPATVGGASAPAR